MIEIQPGKIRKTLKHSVNFKSLLRNRGRTLSLSRLKVHISCARNGGDEYIILGVSQAARWARG